MLDAIFVLSSRVGMIDERVPFFLFLFFTFSSRIM